MDDAVSQTLSFFNQFKSPEIYIQFFHMLTTPGWWQLLLCFFSCTFLMIASLNAIEKNGFEGTLVGTLIMPYFSGFPNLCFAYLMAQKGENGTIVLENCLVNNVTTLTVVLAIPAVFWCLDLLNSKRLDDNEMKINRLSLILSIFATAFFGAGVLILSQDGALNQTDGFILVGIFLFWQLFNIFDVLKNKTRKSLKIKPRIWFDFTIVCLCAWGIFSSIDQLIEWVSQRPTGLVSRTNLGLLSGILMVLPNAFLAIYYSAFQRSDIAYSSQVGDCHICIPLCIGIYAVFSPIQVASSYLPAIYILVSATMVHFIFLTFIGRLPRWAGLCLSGLYGLFLFKGGL